MRIGIIFIYCSFLDMIFLLTQWFIMIYTYIPHFEKVYILNLYKGMISMVYLDMIHELHHFPGKKSIHIYYGRIHMHNHYQEVFTNVGGRS